MNQFALPAGDTDGWPEKFWLATQISGRPCPAPVALIRVSRSIAWPVTVWQAAVRFAKNPRGILTLYGPNGTGKTHLLVAIGNELLSRGVAATRRHRA